MNLELRRLAAIVEASLGISDSDGAVSGFLRQISASAESAAHFRRLVHQQGGDDFSDAMLGEFWTAVHAKEQNDVTERNNTRDSRGVTANSSSPPVIHSTESAGFTENTRADTRRPHVLDRKNFAHNGDLEPVSGPRLRTDPNGSESTEPADPARHATPAQLYLSAAGNSPFGNGPKTENPALTKPTASHTEIPATSHESANTKSQIARRIAREREKRHPSASGAKKPNRPADPGSDSRDMQSRAQPTSADELVIGNVYRGRVLRTTPFGAFVTLGAVSGLCHVSKMAQNPRVRTEHPDDVARAGDLVYVRVTAVEHGDGLRRLRISLSMAGLDQQTGHEVQVAAPEKFSDKPGAEPGTDDSSVAAKRRRLTAPERWELRQLIALGAAQAADYPELEGGADDDDGFGDSAGAAAGTIGETAENLPVADVEIQNTDPDFLRGKPRLPAAAPVALAIDKMPEGLMARTAMTGLALAQEMRAERQKSARADRDKRPEYAEDDPVAKAAAGDTEDRAEGAEAAIAAWRKSQKKQRGFVEQPLSEQRRQLPVYAMRRQLVDLVRQNQFLVVVGETGSGKTTQIVQYLYEEGFADDGIIACTQPRRVAAISVAKRVAQEVGCAVGAEVGYTVRFDDTTSAKTRIRYMTDGMLQREALADPGMTKYSVVMLDEAHERTVATDVLFALLKTAAKSNPRLRVIATSATLDSAKFAAYFGNCPVATIPGRTFPVDVKYLREPEPDYLAAALDTVMQITVGEPAGDVLVFLTGQDEIDQAVDALTSRAEKLGLRVASTDEMLADTAAAGSLAFLPIYAALPPDNQALIFRPAPAGGRKIVLATNIAETSITIDGVRYVVDPGYAKISAYDPRAGMDMLTVQPILRAQANQRSGRAGRTGPGKCFRLYTENAFFNEMPSAPTPEIQRQNLAHTALMLKAIGIHDVLGFDYMDAPAAPTLVAALHELYTLDALDDAGTLTPLGRRMAHLPMEPALAKTLLALAAMGCGDAVLVVVAMLSVQGVFYRPRDRMAAAEAAHRRLQLPSGDHVTLLTVYRRWAAAGRLLRWCRDNFVHERSMRRADAVRTQLAAAVGRWARDAAGDGGAARDVRHVPEAAAVVRAFVAGYFRSTARRDPHDGTFRTLADGAPVHVHPLLALAGRTPRHVIYHLLVRTSREYMQCCLQVDPQWLVELAPRFFRPAATAGKIVPLFDRHALLQDAWRLTAQIDAKRRMLSKLHD